jgi:hypothetical protein
MRKLFECSHYFILNVSTEKWLDAEFKEGQSPDELQQILFSVIPFKLPKLPKPEGPNKEKNKK